MSLFVDLRSFLAELFPSTEISVAHLGSGIHFSRARAPGERSNPSHIFLRIVFAVAWHMKEWRLLIHPAHFAGLAIMLGIFAAWAIPFLHSTPAQVAAVKWSNQFTGRLQGFDFKFASWIQNIPRGLIYFFALGSFVPFRQDFKVSRSL